MGIDVVDNWREQVLTGAHERDTKERATLESWLAEGFQALVVGPGSAVGRAVQERQEAVMRV